MSLNFVHVRDGFLSSSGVVFSILSFPCIKSFCGVQLCLFMFFHLLHVFMFVESGCNFFIAFQCLDLCRCVDGVLHIVSIVFYLFPQCI